MTFSGLKLFGGPFALKVRDYPLPTIISTKVARPLQVLASSCPIFGFYFHFSCFELVGNRKEMEIEILFRFNNNNGK